MDKELKFNRLIELEYHDPRGLVAYEQNARDHKDLDIEAIRASIREFGFNDPIGIWSDQNIIVEGHGRQLAAIDEGLDKVPCIRLDHLTDEERRAYALAHNKTAELSEWNFAELNLELAGIKEIDMSQLGFAKIETTDDYEAFEAKFDIKKTTDDCYTPRIVYAAVADYVAKTYKVKKENFVRPFFPGGTTRRRNTRRAA